MFALVCNFDSCCFDVKFTFLNSDLREYLSYAGSLVWKCSGQKAELKAACHRQYV